MKKRKNVTIVVANKKGGVGKSTTSLALYSCLTELGYKCLLIDNDPQCNSSLVFKADMSDGIPTLYDVYFPNEKPKMKDIIQHTEFGDIVPADKLLQEAEKAIPQSVKMYKYLLIGIESVSDIYDFTIVDTGPSLGILTGNALYAADYVLTPVDCSLFSVQGLISFYKFVKEFQEDRTPDRPLKMAGLLIVKYKSRLNLTADILESLENTAKTMNCKVFDSKIRESVRVQEAQVLRVPLGVHAPNCTSYADYMNFTKELLEIIGGNN